MARERTLTIYAYAALNIWRKSSSFCSSSLPTIPLLLQLTWCPAKTTLCLYSFSELSSSLCEAGTFFLSFQRNQPFHCSFPPKKQLPLHNMVSSIKTAAALVGALANVVCGHFHVTGIVADGVYYGVSDFLHDAWPFLSSTKLFQDRQILTTECLRFNDFRYVLLFLPNRETRRLTRGTGLFVRLLL